MGSAGSERRGGGTGALGGRGADAVPVGARLGVAVAGPLGARTIRSSAPASRHSPRHARHSRAGSPNVASSPTSQSPGSALQPGQIGAEGGSGEGKSGGSIAISRPNTRARSGPSTHVASHSPQTDMRAPRKGLSRSAPLRQAGQVRSANTIRQRPLRHAADYFASASGGAPLVARAWRRRSSVKIDSTIPMSTYIASSHTSAT